MRGGIEPITWARSMTAAAYLPWALVGWIPASAPHTKRTPKAAIRRSSDMRCSTISSTVMPASAVSWLMRGTRLRFAGGEPTQRRAHDPAVGEVLQLPVGGVAVGGQCGRLGGPPAVPVLH